MTDINQRGDVEAALAAAEPTAQVLEFDHSRLVVAHPSDVQITTVDLEQFKVVPQRPRGTITALTCDGFVTAFNQRVRQTIGGATVYADVVKNHLVAVLNDDDEEAGWRDYRIEFGLELTPEWRHWTTNQGLGTQERFAEIIEAGETDIRNPASTVMLDLAQTFHASSSAKFKQAGRLKDGRAQLVYEEEIEASAGEGLVSVPDAFTLSLRPFFGAEPVAVTCRLRYRLERGALSIGYQIVRPDDLVRAAFGEVVQVVADQVAPFLVVEGRPGSPLSAR